MSAEALPITAARFSKALEDLPISSLYAKHAELTNQIQHLESSNKQLEDFARENDDRDCYEALMENRQVMKRFEERKELIRKEVQEVRGLPWKPQDEDSAASAVTQNGTAPTTSNGTGNSVATSSGMAATQEQDNGTGPQGEDGVFL